MKRYIVGKRLLEESIETVKSPAGAAVSDAAASNGCDLVL